MPEPTISCPHCRSEIKLTEPPGLMAASVVGATTAMTQSEARLKLMGLPAAVTVTLSPTTETTLPLMAGGVAWANAGAEKGINLSLKSETTFRKFVFFMIFAKNKNIQMDNKK